jgi:hypothetical protein
MIANGTLVLALFGPRGYGLRNGVLAVPTRMVESLAPPLFGLLIDRMVPLAVAVSAGLCLFAFALLWLLRPAPRVGGRAGSERLTITEEVEPMRTRLFLVFALLLAMLPIPHLRRASPQARSERC